MDLYVVYDHPRDAPDLFVVRRWEIGPRQVTARGALGAKTLDDARSILPAGLTCIGRQPADDPVIVEVWI